MNQRAAQYAQWIVENADKKGTPEFDTVAKAYEAAKAKGVDSPMDESVVKSGSFLNQIPRQAGLGARYLLEGVSAAPQIITEPIRYFTDRAGEAVTGKPATSKPLTMLGSDLADRLGLPKPENATERVVADATRLGYGTMGGMGIAKGVSGLMDDVTKGLAPKVGGIKNAVSATVKNLTTQPLAQTTAAAGAGYAGGASREAGGSPWQQATASVVGGVVGGLAPGAVNSVVNRFNSMLTSPQQLEVKISSALKAAGMDWDGIPKSIQAQMLEDVRKATRGGKPLSPDALRRYTDFQIAGIKPTRGQLTLDPVQLTREKNLAKVGANSSDSRLQGLALQENQANSQLIRNMNRLGADQGDEFGAGFNSINRITSLDESMGNRVSDLYDAARKLPGGEVPLNRADLVNNIYANLASKNKLAFLPTEVSNMLDDISAGVVKRGGQTFEVPFDANALDNLLTTIATAQRGTNDGNVKMALSLVRQAIDDTPLQPVKTTFGGNQLVTQQGADFLKNQDAQAGSFMEALNKARAAARERFNWRESSKPVEAALGGAEPDKFVKRFVIDGNYRDAQALAQTGDRAAIRDALATWLKKQALSGAEDEVGKFSQSAFNKALNKLGESKLRLFFTKEEIQQLQANARVSSYLQFQPAGSAVNNSNSGALMLGQTYDWLNAVAGKVPFGKQLIVDPAENIFTTLATRGAQNPLPALAVQPNRPVSPVFIGPAIAAGGLLSAP